VSKTDGGDLQILGSDFLAKQFQRIKEVRRVIVPGKHKPGGKNLNLLYQSLVGGNLISGLGFPPDRREPARSDSSTVIAETAASNWVASSLCSKREPAEVRQVNSLT
jgi:hypothetical protein